MIEEYERKNYLSPSIKKTAGLPVDRWGLWCGMFAPKGCLEWFYGLPVGLHYQTFKDPKTGK
jgi:hypothetical protein